MSNEVEKQLFGDYPQVQTTDLEEVLLSFMDDLAVINKELDESLTSGLFHHLFTRVMKCENAKGKVHYHFAQRDKKEGD